MWPALRAQSCGGILGADEVRRNHAAMAVECPAAPYSDLRGEGRLAADMPVPE